MKYFIFYSDRLLAEFDSYEEASIFVNAQKYPESFTIILTSGAV